jgi:hypothetical protein
MSNIRSLKPGSDGPITPSGGDGMEARIAKLESDVSHIQSDIRDIKDDLKRLPDKLDSIKDAISSAKIWAILLYVALAASLLYVMAHGFKWL